MIRKKKARFVDAWLIFFAVTPITRFVKRKQVETWNKKTRALRTPFQKKLNNFSALADL